MLFGSFVRALISLLEGLVALGKVALMASELRERKDSSFASEAKVENVRNSLPCSPNSSFWQAWQHKHLFEFWRAKEVGDDWLDLHAPLLLFAWSVSACGEPTLTHEFQLIKLRLLLRSFPRALDAFLP